MTVWVTRDEPADGPLSSALRQLGLAVVLEPVIERKVIASPAELLARLGADDWLVLTSPFAIQAVATEPAARIPHVAVVGESSHKLAADAGLRVDLVGADGHGDTLFAELRQQVTHGIVCYPRSSKAKPLESWGDVDVRCPVLYDTVPRGFDCSVVSRVAIAAVASPSAVKALGDIDVPLASIGRATTAAIRATGREPVVEPPYPTFENLARAIADYLRS
jgi:uroporphyrinogen-III synthase